MTVLKPKAFNLFMNFYWNKKRFLWCQMNINRQTPSCWPRQSLGTAHTPGTHNTYTSLHTMPQTAISLYTCK